MLDAIDTWILGLEALDYWKTLGWAAFVTGFAVYDWNKGMRKARLVEDTPTSTCRGAAMGYVELEGTQRALPGAPVIAPLSGRACTWWSYTIERYVRRRDHDESGWEQIDAGSSHAPFLIEDATGQALVAPARAAVTAEAKLVWKGSTPRPLAGFDPTGRGDYRYTEYRMEAGDPLYALGRMERLDDIGDVIDRGAEITALLAEAQKDPSFLRRVDANDDGIIDAAEKHAAGRAASQTIHGWMKQVAAIAPQNVLRAPTGRQPFMLSTQPQEQIVARARGRTRIGLAVLLLGAASLAYLLSVRPPF